MTLGGAKGPQSGVQGGKKGITIRVSGVLRAPNWGSGGPKGPKATPGGFKWPRNGSQGGPSGRKVTLGAASDPKMGLRWGPNGPKVTLRDPKVGFPGGKKGVKKGFGGPKGSQMGLWGYQGSKSKTGRVQRATQWVLGGSQWRRSDTEEGVKGPRMPGSAPAPRARPWGVPSVWGCGQHTWMCPARGRGQHRGRGLGTGGRLPSNSFLSTARDAGAAWLGRSGEKAGNGVGNAGPREGRAGRGVGNPGRPGRPGGVSENRGSGWAAAAHAQFEVAGRAGGRVERPLVAALPPTVHLPYP